MQHYAAFHLGLHCLQKYSFRGFPDTKIKYQYLLCWPKYSNKFYNVVEFSDEKKFTGAFDPFLLQLNLYFCC